MSGSDIPQWKKDLIARLRSQNKRTAMVPVPSSSVQEPVSSSRASEKCECATKMVQERSWNGPSEDEEDLHYGPGIVSKLKERYLSLAQREKSRPSILRKAASLENILDEVQDSGNRLFQTKQNADTKTTQNRYRNMKRGPEMKRARSVETISNTEAKEEKENKPKRESMHEEMLIKGSELIMEKPEMTYTQRVNRPKRIQPVMNEKEKPPVDVVKQAKMIFERRPEQRTKPPQHTGEVAAKVATYKSIIVQNKKKPAIKTKPNITRVRTKDIRPISPEVSSPKSSIKNKFEVPTPPASPKINLLDFEKKIHNSENNENSLPSPIPDISRVDFKGDDCVNKTTSLTETPDLIITSSPLPVVNSPSFRISATENFIKEEIRLASTDRSLSSPAKPQSPVPTTITLTDTNTSTTMTFNFAANNNAAATTPAPKNENRLPVNKNVLNTQTPPSQPLKLEINGVHEPKKPPPRNSKLLSPSPSPSNEVLKTVNAKPNLTILEIEKNLINAAKTLQQPPPPSLKNHTIATINGGSSVIKSVEQVTVKVPKVKKPPRDTENTSIVFKFTDRKDVPDYVHNDGVKRVAKLEKPKVGEGGIILLPGASVGESFTDEDEEILRSLEGPPSPCDVTFINDNILIDGKSSLSQKTKKAKLKISFVEEGPEIYEYPSETSLLIEEIAVSPPLPHMRNSVPITGTSSLANYTPKTSTADFQPGVTRSVVNAPTSSPIKQETVDADLILHEVEKPIMFSAGANSDILF